LSALGAAALELARKCKTDDDERAGVVTYSALWGPRRAGMATALVLATSLVFALMAFVVTRSSGWWFLPAAVAGFAAFLAAARYAERPTRPHARRVLLWTAAWIGAVYACIGIAPLVVRLATGAGA
jgi:4-hydroxybenzoate polyprenyltransferase